MTEPVVLLFRLNQRDHRVHIVNAFRLVLIIALELENLNESQVMHTSRGRETILEGGGKGARNFVAIRRNTGITNPSSVDSHRCTRMMNARLNADDMKRHSNSLVPEMPHVESHDVFLHERHDHIAPSHGEHPRRLVEHSLDRIFRVIVVRRR